MVVVCLCCFDAGLPAFFGNQVRHPMQAQTPAFGVGLYVAQEGRFPSAPCRRLLMFSASAGKSKKTKQSHSCPSLKVWVLALPALIRNWHSWHGVGIAFISDQTNLECHGCSFTVERGGGGMVTQRSIRAFRVLLHATPTPLAVPMGSAFKAPSCRRSDFPTDVQSSPSYLPLKSMHTNFRTCLSPPATTPWLLSHHTKQKESFTEW